MLSCARDKTFLKTPNTNIILTFLHSLLSCILFGIMHAYFCDRILVHAYVMNFRWFTFRFFVHTLCSFVFQCKGCWDQQGLNSAFLKNRIQFSKKYILKGINISIFLLASFSKSDIPLTLLILTTSDPFHLEC